MITFHPAFKLWWPETDGRAKQNYEWLARRSKDARLCFPFCKDGLVVQAGGHVGLWPIILAEHFHTVLSFECDPPLYAALKKNTLDRNLNIHTSPCALGRTEGKAVMQRKGSPGSSLIVPDAITGTSDVFEVNMIAIDDLELSRCDALILDIEGWELEALAGAEKTIERFHPFLHLEASRLPEQDKWLDDHGYKFVARMHSDRLFVHKGRT